MWATASALRLSSHPCNASSPCRIYRMQDPLLLWVGRPLGREAAGVFAAVLGGAATTSTTLRRPAPRTKETPGQAGQVKPHQLPTRPCWRCRQTHREAQERFTRAPPTRHHNAPRRRLRPEHLPVVRLHASQTRTHVHAVTEHPNHSASEPCLCRAMPCFLLASFAASAPVA
jgi:hypothetical protein